MKTYLFINAGEMVAASFCGVIWLAHKTLTACKDRTAFLYKPGDYSGLMVTMLDEKGHYKEVEILPEFATKCCNKISEFTAK